VLLASELAVLQEVPLVRQCRPGRRAYHRWSHLVVLAPAVCLAARPAPAAQPGSLLRLSDQQPPQLPDRLELLMLLAGFQDPGAAVAAPGYEPAAQPEQLDQAEWSARLPRSTRPHLARVASLCRELASAAQAEQTA
jgi:hypothetical protein